MLHVTDFLHYLYVGAPVGFAQKDCEPFKAYLDAQVAQHQPAIHMVQMVMRENIYGFQGNQQNPFLKITVTDPKYINRVRTTIKDGNANWKGMWKNDGSGLVTFDNIQYVMRFMVDCKVCGIVWLQRLLLMIAGRRYVLGRGQIKVISNDTTQRKTVELSNRSRGQLSTLNSTQARRRMVEDGTSANTLLRY